MKRRNTTSYAIFVSIFTGYFSRSRLAMGDKRKIIDVIDLTSDDDQGQLGSL